MALTVQQLLSPQKAADIRAGMVAALISLDVRADLWKAGGVASTILTVVSITFANFSQLIANTLSGYFLPTAFGDGLVLLALYVYGVVAPTATFATGKVTLTNGGGSTFTQAIGTVKVQNPDTKQTYSNTTAFTLGPGETLEIAVQCTAAGSVGNSTPGTITKMVTVLSNVTCSNAASVVGSDKISDVALRQLCLDSLAANSPYGPRGAYGYAIRTATNPISGAAVNINRYTISPSSSTGIVTLYVASPSGAPDPSDVTGVSTSIEAKARPDTVTVNLSGAVTLNYTQTIRVNCQMPAGTSAAAVKTACDAAMLTFFENYPISGVQQNDDDNPNGFQGLSGDAVKGALSVAVASLGGQFLSAKGAVDLALTGNQVAANAVTIVPVILQSNNGVFV